MALWNSSGVKVFDGTGSASWADLDLTKDHLGSSSGAPAAEMMAFLVIQIQSSGSNFAARAKGDSTNYWQSANYSKGASLGISHTSGGNQALLLAVPTDSNGVCQWYGIAASTTVHLLGWVECTFDGTRIYDAALINSWTDLDVDAIVSGTDDSLLFLKILRDGGSNQYVGTRINGDESDLLDAAAGTRGGVGQTSLISTTVAHSLLVPTDVNGIFEHYAKNTPVPNADIWLTCYEKTGWEIVQEIVFASATPPTSYTDLDLTAHLGTCDCLVFLKFSRGSGGGGTYVALACRGNGSSDDFLLKTATFPGACACGSIDEDKSVLLCCEAKAGIVEWSALSSSYNIEVELVGFISEAIPPTYGSEAPTGSSVVPDADVEISISDDVSVTQASIDLDLTDPDSTTHNVIINGVFQSGWNGTISANGSNGYDVVVNSHDPFIVGLWTCDVYAEDACRGADYSWSFTVIADPPSVRSTIPDSGEVVMENPSSIFVSVEDDWGIDTTTVDLVATSSKNETLQIISGGVFQAGYYGTIQVNGYTGVDILVHWPDLENGLNWRFDLDLTSIVGVDL